MIVVPPSATVPVPMPPTVPLTGVPAVPVGTVIVTEAMVAEVVVVNVYVYVTAVWLVAVLGDTPRGVHEGCGCAGRRVHDTEQRADQRRREQDHEMSPRR